MIPGLRIIDDILKGLPENARLRAQLSELRAQVEGLQRELEDARIEINRLRQEQQPQRKLSEGHIHILKLLDKHQDCVKTEDVAAQLSLDVSDVRYLIIELIRRDYLGDFVAGLGITDKGKMFVHESPV
jgi:uncharacterized protein (DUF3084 family)